MELSQNLWQDFTFVEKDKQTFYQKWSCHKIYGKYKIFLMAVYMIFKYGKRFRFANLKLNFFKALAGLIVVYVRIDRRKAAVSHE